MKYSLMEELNGKIVDANLKENVFTVLKDIVKRPGQIKVVAPDQVVYVGTDEYHGSVRYDRASKMSVDLQGKKLPVKIDVTPVSGYIKYTTEEGLFEFLIIPTGTTNGPEKNTFVNTYNACVNFFDKETVDYVSGLKDRDINEKSFTSICSKYGIVPDEVLMSESKSVKGEDLQKLSEESEKLYYSTVAKQITEFQNYPKIYEEMKQNEPTL